MRRFLSGIRPFLLVAALACAGLPILAQAVEAPITRASVVRDYGRVTFDWGKKVRFSASGSGNRLIISFDRAATPDTGRILSSLSPYVTKAEMGSDQRTLTLTMSKPYRVRSFVSGNVTGVDILGLDPSAKPETAKKEAEKPEKKIEKKPVPPARPARDKEWEAAERAAQELDRTRGKTETKETLKPEAPAEPPVKPAKAETTTASASVGAPKPEASAGIPEKPARVKTPEASAPVEAPKPIEPAAPKPVESAAPKPGAAAPAGEISPAAEPVEAPKADIPKAETSKAETSKAIETAAPAQPAESAATPVEAPTKEASSSPAFLAKTDDQSPPMDEQPPPARPMAEAPVVAPEKPAEAVAPVAAEAAKPAETMAAVEEAAEAEPDVNLPAPELPTAIVLSFPTPSPRAAFFMRGETAWLAFEGEVPASAESLAAQSGVVSASRQMVDGVTLYWVKLEGLAGLKPAHDDAGWNVSLLPAPVAPTIPLSVTRAGDAALLIPAADAPAARLVKLPDPDSGEVLQLALVGATGQGVADQRNLVDAEFFATAQGIAIRAKSDGVTLATTPQGFTVTKPGGLQFGAQADPVIPSVLLPYTQWKAENPAHFTLLRQSLEAQAANAATPAEAAKFHERLAGLYLSEGLASEALGEYAIIRGASPGYYAAHRLAAPNGAANFLLYRIGDALSDFNSPSLAGNAEAERWRALLSELLGSPPAEAFSFPALYPETLRHYPPDVIRKLAVVAGDLALNREQPDEAERIFALLEKDGLLEPIRRPVAFMRGSIAEKRGQFGEAETIWQGLADDLSDRFVRARAAYALVTMKLDQGSIEPDEAIRKLDALRIVWRGDGLELNLLRTLADLYIQKSDDVNALRSLREIVANFPARAEATKAAEQMGGMFLSLFNKGEADKLQPVEALSLYYEFRELTPLGPEGDAMIRGLADRLASVDLLERAAVLLNHQVRYRLEGAERSRVGARLALIYLMNRQPREALDALQFTNFGGNPDGLAQTRNHLAAKALSDIGQPDDAAQLLADDTSDDARMLRVNIYWSAKDWKNVAATVEEILGNRKDITAPLTLLESEYLLKLALAYIFEHDNAQLDYLRDYFSPLMKDNPNYGVFRFITNVDSPLDTRNFDQVSRDISSIRSFMETYEKRVKREGLSGAI